MVKNEQNRANWYKGTKFGTEVLYCILVPLKKLPLAAAILNFKTAAMRPTTKRFFGHNFGSITDTNIMVPTAMTSRGRHGFQDGRHCKCMPFHIARFYAQKKATTMKS
jgi:hypothetical protein